MSTSFLRKFCASGILYGILWVTPRCSAQLTWRAGDQCLRSTAATGKNNSKVNCKHTKHTAKN